MIADCDSSFVYFSDLLDRRFPKVMSDLQQALDFAGVPCRLIQGTRDIWCRDYMPIEVEPGRFVQFRYAPDYLRGRWARTITTPRHVPHIHHCVRSQIILDGGNVVRCADAAILTDKVFSENLGWQPQALLRQLEELLEVQSVVIIPQEPDDIFGHADGIVRFVGERAVLVTDYSRIDAGYQQRLRVALTAAKLELILLPHVPGPPSAGRAANVPSASGIYVNFLAIQRLIFVPVFGLPSDDEAVSILAAAFPDRRIVPIDCRQLAVEGGLLNCISWAVCE